MKLSWRDQTRALYMFLASPLIAGLVLGGCGASTEHDPQPSAAEVKAYLAEIDRREAEAIAKSTRESRAREVAKNRDSETSTSANNLPAL